MILPGRQPHPVDGALGAPHNRRIGYSKQSHRPRERPIGLHLESHPPAYESPKVTVVTVVTVIHSPRNYPVPISTLGHPRWKVEHVWTHHWDKMCVEAPKMYRNATHKLCFLFQDFETRHCHINMRVSPPKWAHLRIWQIDKIQKTNLETLLMFPSIFPDIPKHIDGYIGYTFKGTILPILKRFSAHACGSVSSHYRAPPKAMHLWTKYSLGSGGEEKIPRKAAQMLKNMFWPSEVAW